MLSGNQLVTDGYLKVIWRLSANILRKLRKLSIMILREDYLLTLLSLCGNVLLMLFCWAGAWLSGGILLNGDTYASRILMFQQ